MTEILKGLDSIDWKSLNAPEVPKWLRDLASDDIAVTRDAIENLETQVVFRGAPPSGGYGPIEELLDTEVPFLIVPFLLELLEAPHIKTKGGVMELLYHLVRNVEINIDKLNQNQRDCATKLYQSVQIGVPLYRHSYKNPADWYEKQASLDLLNVFGEST